jgi:hypothetical protein
MASPMISILLRILAYNDGIYDIYFVSLSLFIVYEKKMTMS